MQKIDWYEGGLQLSDISIKNVGEYDLTPIMKYIMVILDNWGRTLVQEGWKNTGYYMEQEFCMTRIDWVEELNQSVWNVWKHWKLSVLELKQCCSDTEVGL